MIGFRSPTPPKGLRYAPAGYRAAWAGRDAAAVTGSGARRPYGRPARVLFPSGAGLGSLVLARTFWGKTCFSLRD
ncbi:MAG TPA: hypothetical protein VK206_18420 [Anaerolineales bacterium]|nr:hypothetical protein [Anaerolineales bacterium]